MTWTPEKEKKLRELWNKGHTASQIATLIGDTTRNAVIGKAHRLNLQARATSRRSTTKSNIENTGASENKNQKQTTTNQSDQCSESVPHFFLSPQHRLPLSTASSTPPR